MLVSFLFLEKNYKKEAQMFYQNHSLVLRSYSWDILKFNFKKSLDLDLKNLELPYWAQVNLFMIYLTRTRKILELPCWTRIHFIMY